MTITIYEDLIQGGPEWLQARCGLLTASEMKLILTPTLKIASNDKERAHVYEIAAQRVLNHVEPHYIGDDMLRGKVEEVEARIKYEDNYAPVKQVGFITNDKWGFKLGYSPDGLIGDDGAVEFKSRRQKYQFQTIATGEVPEEFVLQIQAGLLVSERYWIDFVSYCGGMPMFVKRVYADTEIQKAIIEASTKFHQKVDDVIRKYDLTAGTLVQTERKNYDEEMTVGTYE
jgi:hypothetical protein